MTFGTCTLRHAGQVATFGWSNHASRDKFIGHIERRIAAGARYWVIKPPTIRLLFNYRMGYDHGVPAIILRMVTDEVGGMVKTGEVSIFELQSVIALVRPTTGAIDILHQHTLCQSKDDPIER
jgi:hypothetical protein